MLDIKFIRENPEKVQKGAESKNVKVNISELLELDDARRKYIHEVEEMKAKMNVLNKKIGESKGKDAKSIKESQAIKEKIKEFEPKLDEVEKSLNLLMRQVPNMPLKSVRIGKDESENKVIRKVGKPTKFSAKGGSASGGKFPLDYMELGEKLDIIDTKRAAKVSGTRFGYIKGDLARMEWAMFQYALDILVKNKFKFVLPPVMVSEDSMGAMGYTDRSADEIYHFPEDKLYLVGTSEQAIGPMHKDEVLDVKTPIRYVAFSTCFRREAGSYGKDTKGILRVHQFNKMEMFSFCKPEDSEKEHAFLLSMEEKLMKGLKLPYQVLDICSGDLGDPAAKKYDIEVWLPSENKYRETHSTSNCTDFQARRLNIRYKTKDNQMAFVHTLNGTAFSERPLLAIMENFQNKDGSIKVPAVLQKYCGVKKIS
jgi:seryl-tRNA synthetase